MLRLLFAILIILTISATYYGGKTVTSKSGVTPDSPLYFFDWAIEKIDLFSIKDKEKKVEKLVELITEKINEVALMMEGGKSIVASEALKNSDKYVAQAVDFLNSLQAEGKDVGILKERLAESVISKQKVLAEVYKNAPVEVRPTIEAELKNGEKDAKEIIENLNEETNQKLVINAEQTAILVADKILEVKEQQEKEGLNSLSATEKKFNIWIENFYWTKEDDGRVSISAHIKRRDQKCSRFSGKFNLYVENTFYRSFSLTLNGYDDVRAEFDSIFLESGEYKIKGELLDDKGNIISFREIKIII